MELFFFFLANVVLPTLDLVMDVLAAEKILSFYYDAANNRMVSENTELLPENLE